MLCGALVTGEIGPGRQLSNLRRLKIKDLPR